MTVQERLKKVMRKLNKNTNSLSKEIEVTNSAIGRLLKGETLPSSKILIPLGDKLGVSIDWLLFGEGEMFMNGSKANGDNGSSKKEGKNKDTTGDGSKKHKELQAEIKLLKQQLKEKEGQMESKEQLIRSKDEIIQSKDEIISLLKNK